MRTDRDRQAEALDDIDLLPDDQLDGSAGVLVRTFTESSYPTVAASVYACHAVLVDAAANEGADPSFTEDTSVTLYVANVGSGIPASGSYVVAVSAGGRLVFNFNG